MTAPDDPINTPSVPRLRTLEELIQSKLNADTINEPRRPPHMDSVALLLGRQDTSLEKIKAFGLTFDAGQGGSYFRWHGDTYVSSIPLWVQELLAQERAATRTSTLRAIQQAIGIIP